MSHASPKLHNAMWPGLVGKGTEAGQEPPISLEKMLDLTAAAEVDGQKFEGIDYFLFLPHTNPEASDDELKQIADMSALAAKNGIEPHAGHGLTYDNVQPIAAIPQLAEVSIGHGLTADALEFGMAETVRRFLTALEGKTV